MGGRRRVQQAPGWPVAGLRPAGADGVCGWTASRLASEAGQARKAVSAGVASPERLAGRPQRAAGAHRPGRSPRRQRAGRLRRMRAGRRTPGPPTAGAAKKGPPLGPTAPAPRRRRVRGDSGAAPGSHPGSTALPSCTRPAHPAQGRPDDRPGRRCDFRCAVHIASPHTCKISPDSAASPARRRRPLFPCRAASLSTHRPCCRGAHRVTVS